MINYYPREKQPFEYFMGQSFISLMEKKKSSFPSSRKVPI